MGGVKYRWTIAPPQPARAAELAPEYGLTYLTPVYPIFAQGRYGAFIGRGFESCSPRPTG